MKRCAAILLAAVLCAAFNFNNGLAQNLKIGYVDVFGVFNEYDKTKDYDSKLEKRKEEVEKKLEKKKKEIEKMQSKLELLKDDKKAQEEEKIIDEVKEYRELERSAFTDIKKARDEKMKEIIEDINEIIKEYRKDNKFDLIISKNSVLDSSGAVVDITADILKISNKEFKKKR